MNKRLLPGSKQTNKTIDAYVQAVQKGLQAQHVTPSKNGWVVKRAGAVKSSATFKTQQDAIARARSIAKNNSTELFIHGRDGQIRERASYGKDPYPPKG